MRGGIRPSTPTTQWVAEDCQSGFNFPDDEALIQAEFEKNIPFALAVAESALDPDDPVSVVGRDAEDFRVDSFAVSYGDPQTVAVVGEAGLKAQVACTTASTAARAAKRRPSRSGRAASATASRTSTTTPSTAAS